MAFIALYFTLHSEAMKPAVDIEQNNNKLSMSLPRYETNCRDFHIFANLTVWTAQEAGADTWAEQIIDEGNTLSNHIREVHFGWDAGFRVGLGYGLERCKWDTQAFYTWFYTTGKDEVTSQPGAVHSAFLGNFYVDNPEGAGLSGPSYEKASIEWTISFNMFDWELAGHYCVGQSLSMRPFMGIKGGWINQSINTQWENPEVSSTAFFYKGIENLQNNFWG